MSLTAAMRRGLENPFVVFAPIVKQTLSDVQTLATDNINDPAPILRAALLDETDNAFTLVRGVAGAGLVLGAAAFNAPGALATAAHQALTGDFQGALTTLESVTVVPVTRAAGDIVRAV